VDDCLQILEKETEIEKLSKESQEKILEISGGGFIVYIDHQFIYPVAKMKNLVIAQIKKEELVRERERIKNFFSFSK
jgi:hypothetical protein